MNFILKIIINIYLKTFTLKPKILSTIIFFPLLYILGWLLTRPLIYTSFNYVRISLIGTLFTFIIFLFSLPKWFEVRWGINNIWELFGLAKSHKSRNLTFYFLKGFLYSIILISLILIPIIFTNWGIWLGKIPIDDLINALTLMIGVGFAEELIFRGWLLEELKNQFGIKKAIIFQALIFSIVHVGFDMPLNQILSILSGLFLLGILLAFIRLKDNNSLWGCIGLHGGLVGGWFLSKNSLIIISQEAPSWLVGPGIINTNPLGGLFGITLLLFSCLFYLLRYKKYFKKKINNF